jgi:predicted nucleotidyltransferase
LTAETYRLEPSLISAITRVLEADQQVIFAYLYGSMQTEGHGRDVDIAVYPVDHVGGNRVALDLKIALYHETGMPADVFDVRPIREVLASGDIFGLLYLKNVLEGGRLLVDKDPAVRAEFLERYGFRYRECAGMIQEVLA